MSTANSLESVSTYPLQQTSTGTDSWVGILEFEKTIFVLVNLMDIAMTYRLLETGMAYESNPIANFVINGWGFTGVIAFKLITVAVVLLIANIIAFKRVKTAKALLLLGIGIIGCVVVYSVNLMMTLHGIW